jgi:hypothetical protein
VLIAAIRAPHLRQKTQYGNSPQQKLDCHEGDCLHTYARLQPSDQGCCFMSVFAPVLPRSWPTFAFVPNDTIDSLRSKSAMHPRQMRQERFFGQNEDYPISRASPPGFSPR